MLNKCINDVNYSLWITKKLIYSRFLKVEIHYPLQIFSAFFLALSTYSPECFLVYTLELISRAICIKISLKHWIDIVMTILLNFNHLSYIKLSENIPPTAISMFICLWCKELWCFKVFYFNKKNSSKCFQYPISFVEEHCNHICLKWFKKN